MAAFMDLVRSRRSIRRFLDRPVEREKITVCLEAARLAPSAHNAQPARYIVIDAPELKEDVCRAAFSGIYSMCRFAAQAPVMIVILAKTSVVAHQLAPGLQGVPFHFVDIGIAGEHFILQAEELGLSTCWIGWFNGRKVRKALKVPRRYKIVALLPVGHAASRPPRPTVRKPLEEVAWWNGLGREEEEKETGADRKPEG